MAYTIPVRGRESEFKLFYAVQIMRNPRIFLILLLFTEIFIVVYRNITALKCRFVERFSGQIGAAAKNIFINHRNTSLAR
ncbi:MAG: hypothetical protein LBI92_04415 [Azoarcus sp.]|nr:hypothetical protein [Azoarcus sp.]